MPDHKLKEAPVSRRRCLAQGLVDLGRGFSAGLKIPAILSPSPKHVGLADHTNIRWKDLVLNLANSAVSLIFGKRHGKLYFRMWPISTQLNVPHDHCPCLPDIVVSSWLERGQGTLTRKIVKQKIPKSMLTCKHMSHKHPHTHTNQSNFVTRGHTHQTKTPTAQIDGVRYRAKANYRPVDIDTWSLSGR